MRNFYEDYANLSNTCCKDYEEIIVLLVHDVNCRYDIVECLLYHCWKDYVSNLDEEPTTVYRCRNKAQMREDIKNGAIKDLYEKLPIEVLFRRYDIVKVLQEAW